MRAYASVVLALLVGTCAWAQRGAVRGGTGGGLGNRGGGFVGHRGGFVGNFGFRSGFGYGRSGFYTPYLYSWPLFSDYSYNAYSPYVWNYGYGYPSVPVASPYTYGYEPAPPVVISQTFVQPATPVIHDYTQPVRVYEPPEPPPPQPKPGQSTIYLIAFQNDVIRPALAYWVDGATLHYLGLDHREQHAPLATVNRDLSDQLNRERRVPFRLPE